MTDQHAPSTGQPGVDLEAIHRRFSPLVLNSAVVIGPTEDYDALVAEVESLRQQLAAAQQERDTWKMAQEECHELQLLAEAQVEELRQRVSDYYAAEGTAIVQRNAALNEALAYKYQVEAMRGVVEGWREYWLHDRECQECHRVRRLGQACWEQVQRFERVWTAGKAALAAASAGQPER